jgi:hypothetical protein
MKLLEKIKEMVEVFDSNIFDTKVVNKETELDGMPLVAPETRGGSHFIVAFGNKAGLKQIVGKDASLGKSITALVDFKVNPTITITVLTHEFVLLDEFSWNVCDFDADISGSGIWVSRRSFSGQ